MAITNQNEIKNSPLMEPLLGNPLPNPGRVGSPQNAGGFGEGTASFPPSMLPDPYYYGNQELYSYDPYQRSYPYYDQYSYYDQYPYPYPDYLPYSRY